MPVTLDDLYKPISDFFLKKFGTGADAFVAFRFDKFGSLLTDADFIDENHPERGLQEALAVEKFSDLVNRVPVDAGDGSNAILSQAAIDDIYFFRLLTPSMPAIPGGVDAATKTSITDSFNQVKAEALREWNRLTLQSSSGLMLNFKPSTAEPENWYDPAATQAWTNQTFHIEGSSQPPPPSQPAPQPLLRLRPSPEVLVNRLRLDPDVLQNRSQFVRALAVPAAPPPADPAPAPADPGPTLGRVAMKPMASANVARIPIAGRLVDGPEPGEDLHGAVAAQFRTMQFDERAVVNQRIQEVLPTAHVDTPSVSISFDYCLVNIHRPWWMDAFVNSGTWYLPGMSVGEVTAGDRPGTIAWLPVGFVAVRNLSISAQWSAEDSANLGSVTDFGPFQVESSGGQTLTHAGLQVSAWLLQRLPALPPSDAAVATQGVPAIPPRTYTVVAGDTLSKIAKQFYGDGSRYPEIQHANGIADSNKIFVGQVLTIP